MQTKRWRRFLKICSHLSDEKKMSTFLTFFLTPSEREELAMRLAIVEALLEGKQTQREIAEHLKASIATITRGSNLCKSIPAELKALLQEPLP